MWRPNNWEKIAEKASIVTCHFEEGSPPNIITFRQLIEVGADAMLGELRNMGFNAESIRDLDYPKSETLTIPTFERMKRQVEVQGKWVFIPDEEAKDE